MEAFCLKCRTKREMQDEKQITMKNGKPATQGTCPVCGTKMFKIGAGGGSQAAGGGAKAGSGARSGGGSKAASGRAASGGRTSAGTGRGGSRR